MTTQTLFDLATHALREAVRKVVEERVREGRPIAVWRDGRAMWVDPRTDKEVTCPAQVAEDRPAYGSHTADRNADDFAPKKQLHDAHGCRPEGAATT